MYKTRSFYGGGISVLISLLPLPKSAPATSCFETTFLYLALHRRASGGSIVPLCGFPGHPGVLLPFFWGRGVQDVASQRDLQVSSQLPALSVPLQGQFPVLVPIFIHFPIGLSVDSSIIGCISRLTVGLIAILVLPGVLSVDGHGRMFDEQVLEGIGSNGGTDLSLGATEGWSRSDDPGGI